MSENTKNNFNEVVRFLKNTTNLPKSFYKDLQTKIINMDPEYLKKYKLIH